MIKWLIDIVRQNEAGICKTFSDWLCINVEKCGYPNNYKKIPVK